MGCGFIARLSAVHPKLCTRTYTRGMFVAKRGGYGTNAHKKEEGSALKLDVVIKKGVRIYL